MHALAGVRSGKADTLMIVLLKVACHMAATPSGRSCLAAAGCLPRWLSKARQVPRQLLPLLLMVPLSCMADWTRAVYFETLFRDRQWVEERVSTGGYTSEEILASCPLLLKQQVRSRGVARPTSCPPGPPVFSRAARAALLW
jgi:hypothetical protein